MDDHLASSSVALILSLPITPALVPLVEAAPITHPSLLPSKLLTSFIGRLTTSLTARDEPESTRRAALGIARTLVRSDEEGWVLDKTGRAWVGACMGVLSVSGPHACR